MIALIWLTSAQRSCRIPNALAESAAPTSISDLSCELKRWHQNRQQRSCIRPSFPSYGSITAHRAHGLRARSAMALCGRNRSVATTSVIEGEADVNHMTTRGLVVTQIRSRLIARLSKQHTAGTRERDFAAHHPKGGWHGYRSTSNMWCSQSAELVAGVGLGE